LTFPGGRYLVVLDRVEADIVCDYIRHGGDRDAFLARFAHAVSPGFDPDRDLVRVGLANQTTMLMSESLEIGVVVERAMRDRYGDAALAAHYRAFDTICSATQERQDAVVDLLDRERVDLMVVIGGYNSSNTCNLARLCAARVPTYHIADAECLLSGQTIRHRPVGIAKGQPAEIETTSWLPGGAISVGLTAGASTPNAIVGRVVQRLADLSAGNGQ
jgi:4-hydroxy-3-methylbut-2-en-1-yl diphosphate reductase